jgi:hypothetical protein
MFDVIRAGWRKGCNTKVAGQSAGLREFFPVGKVLRSDAVKSNARKTSGLVGEDHLLD